MNRKEHYFIYPRDMHGKRTGHTICVVLREGMMFHGETLCGPRDQFSKKEGRLIAFGRAQDAYQRYLSRQKAKLGEGN